MRIGLNFDLWSIKPILDQSIFVEASTWVYKIRTIILNNGHSDQRLIIIKFHKRVVLFNTFVS